LIASGNHATEVFAARLIGTQKAVPGEPWDGRFYTIPCAKALERIYGYALRAFA
jgi:hypothetical protein